MADETPPLDPLESLQRNVEDGVQSIIHYDKHDGKGVTRRVIEPHSISHGLSGLVLRATEVEPQQGARHYMSSHIVDVEPHDVPLAAPRGATERPLPEVPLEVPVACFVGKAPTIEPTSDGPLPVEGDDGVEGEGGAAGAGGVTVVPAVPSLLQLPLERAGFNAYLDAVRDAVLDLVIEDAERTLLASIRTQRGLSVGQVRAAHARVFSEYVMGYSNDGDIDDDEVAHLQRLKQCLDEVGWGPG